jgi:hypothetical protein
MNQMSHRIGAVLRRAALLHDPPTLHEQIPLGKALGEIQILDRDRDIERCRHAAQRRFRFEARQPMWCVAFHPGWGESHPGWQDLSDFEEGDLFSQDLMRGAIAQALAGRAVEAIGNGLISLSDSSVKSVSDGRKRRIRPLQFSTPPFARALTADRNNW